uniref:Uncharacterized protein n=1 Tax=Acrobeloides nanus TaxID=290746 RepID=A0A914DAH4_9BILA
MVDTAPSCPINPNLFKFENKPKQALSHEIGAGSLCLKCDCPGLDLHFWRKICKICTCRLDDHDVILPNELDHGDLVFRKLFGGNEKFGTYANPNISQSCSSPVTNGLGQQLQKIQISNKNNSTSNSPSNNTNGQFSNKTSSTNGHSEQSLQENLMKFHRKSSQDSNSSSSTTTTVTTSNFVITNGSSKSSKNSSSIYEKNRSVSEYTWVPSGSQTLVEKYMLQLPETERPIAGTEGAQLRRQRLAHQLPYHDCDPEAAKSLLTEEDKQQHKNFVEYVKENAVGIGELMECSRYNIEKRCASTQADTPIHIAESMTCKTCTQTIKTGDIGIVTDHGKPNEAWHPNCFKCETCEQLLVDLLYFFKDGQYHCGRHFGEQLFPRCSGCDELIFAKEYTFAEEKSWHVDHFCCFGCDKHLAGHRYIVKEDRPYCFDCYMDKFARTCHACNNKIAPFDIRVSHKDFHWHAHGKCFKCKICEKPLANQKFLIKNEEIFCSIDCKNKFETRMG